MRLFADARWRWKASSLTAVALSGCALIGGKDAQVASVNSDQANAIAGPAGDYPVVLGDPFTIDGELYTPSDTLNYDAVGYASIDQGSGITAAHRTLPLPSYAEVTSLDTGKTILVRIERRGPGAGNSLLALSPAASTQLGAGDGTPVRVRRVNPQEAERAELRAGRAAPDRIETPKSLIAILRRKLPGSVAQLRTPVAPAEAAVAAAPEPAKQNPTAQAAAAQVVTAYPLAPLSGASIAPRTVTIARSELAPVSFSIAPSPSVGAKPAVSPSKSASTGISQSAGFVIQAGAFANETNARRAAKALGGFVSPAGKLYRVRTGPFASRGQADAALAKVRAAGYGDARVLSAS